MSFANIAALWYLFPLAGVIILLYLLRMRRKDFRVPATFLWPSQTTDVRANAPIQKLRFSWLMVLQLLAIALIIGSFARPQTKQEGLAGVVTVFVVDTSASMSSREGSGTRVDEAIRRIRSAISTARPGDRFSLIEAGPIPRVLLALSNDSARMRGALEQLAPTHTRSDVGGALRLAAALVGSMESGNIVLLSDGAFPEIANFSQGKAAVHFQKIGAASDNVAITALGVGAAQAGRQLFCGVRNYSPSSKQITLTFYADGSVFESKSLQISASTSIGHSTMLPAGAKVLEARIEPLDALNADNVAFALASPGASVRVLLVTKGNLFLERALSLDSRIVLDKAEVVPESERGSGSGGVYDVVVFDTVKEVPVKARGILAFGEPGEGSIVKSAGTAIKPRSITTESDSPIMRYVDLSGAFIDKSAAIAPVGGARTVAQSVNGPLIVVSDVDKKRIHVGFSVLDSDFALQVGFPIFIGNAIEFMGSQARSDATAIQTGRTLSFPAKSDASGELLLPNGSKEKIEADAGSYILRNLNQVGKYVFQADGKNSVYYANLLDEKESDITASDSLRVNSSTVLAAKAPARIADFWRPLLLLCLAVLACEWWLFAKKS